SRRRHTSSKRDWSSDVCSSDLQVGLCPKVPVERWLLHPQMRSQRPCGETVDPRVIQHMPRTAQDCCTIESRLFLSHACTLSSITLSLLRCHFSLPLVARWPRSSSRLASTRPAWAW